MIDLATRLNCPSLDVASSCIALESLGVIRLPEDGSLVGGPKPTWATTLPFVDRRQDDLSKVGGAT